MNFPATTDSSFAMLRTACWLLRMTVPYEFFRKLQRPAIAADPCRTRTRRYNSVLPNSVCRLRTILLLLAAVGKTSQQVFVGTVALGPRSLGVGGKQGLRCSGRTRKQRIRRE